MNTTLTLSTLPAHLQKIALLFGLVEDQAAERERAAEIQRKEDEKLAADQAAQRAQEKARNEQAAADAKADEEKIRAEAEEKRRQAEAAQAEADKLA
jgi:hypothetical protein